MKLLYRLSLILGVFLLIILGIMAVLLSHKQTHVMPKTILGYYTVYEPEDKSAYDSLLRYSSFMNQISTAPFNLTSAGTILGIVPSEGIQLANSKKIKTFAIITNQTNGTFEPSLSHSILTDPIVRKSSITNILKLIMDNGYKGVNVDFENMLATDRPYYTEFISELADILHSNGFSLIVSVMAKTTDSPISSWIGAFDYAALGQVVDQIQIMTYDEHDPSGSPGPIASYPWVEEVIQYAVSQIPSTKILFGLASYGYDWNIKVQNYTKVVVWNDIPNLLSTSGAKPQWDTVAQSPYFTYTTADHDQHIVWYENSASIHVKTELVNRYKLGGVSMWSMGFEDKKFWKAVQAGLTKKNSRK